MADSPEPVEHVFNRLQTLLLQVADLNGFLRDLAGVAASAVEAPVSCSITVRHDGRLATAGSSDGRADLLDEDQYAADIGPCLQSLQSGEVVDSPDSRAEQRWTTYMRAAVQAGLRCSLSYPLTVNNVTLGALNVYGFHDAHLFDDPTRRKLELFAAHAAGTLRVAARQIRDATSLAQMEEALSAHTVIDQAAGIIMRDQHCTASTALELMRRESQNSRRLLRDVAADLITRTTNHPPEPGRPFDLSE